MNKLEKKAMEASSVEDASSSPDTKSGAAIPDAVIARQQKEAELKEELAVLDEIVSRAENTQGDLRESVVLLRATLSRMYENFLLQVREGNEKGATDSLDDSGRKAEAVRNIARQMETAMDDFRMKVDELKGQIQN